MNSLTSHLSASQEPLSVTLGAKSYATADLLTNPADHAMSRPTKARDFEGEGGPETKQGTYERDHGGNEDVLQTNFRGNPQQELEDNQEKPGSVGDEFNSK